MADVLDPQPLDLADIALQQRLQQKLVVARNAAQVGKMFRILNKMNAQPGDDAMPNLHGEGRFVVGLMAKTGEEEHMNVWRFALIRMTRKFCVAAEKYAEPIVQTPNTINAKNELKRAFVSTAAGVKDFEHRA